MGCGCGKKKSGETVDDPIFFGEDDGRAPIQVTTTIAISHRKSGDIIWASGSQLDTIINAGWLTVVN